MIDIDAHRGEQDALETARFVVETCFPRSYLEPSKRGYHIYVLIRVGMIPRHVFNLLIGELVESLGALARAEGFSSTVEIKGESTLRGQDKLIESRGSLAALPLLPNGGSGSRTPAMRTSISAEGRSRH
jgi:hypothetical protein